MKREALAVNNNYTTGFYDMAYTTGEQAQIGDYSEYTNQPDEENSADDIYAKQLELLLPTKSYAHPLLVLALMIFCFPIGLFVMLCFTKWGAFPKILITLFVLAVALAVYEILVAKNILLLPSVIEMIKNLFA